ncbi:MAG: helix-turn-helix transcriptional regulator [Deltaproteobacteria bacterium]|jgi:transcriptional regulator with XRE-family HTH domain|nr:helix-turn-helix transcriptional regulator [Deltaproteobacteria bacterium]
MEPTPPKPHINVDYFEDLTGDLTPAEDPSSTSIGDKIRDLRNEKGLSLIELSRLTGFEVELLSNIEKKEFQPQLGTIIRLSKALDGAFSSLVAGSGDKLYSVTRRDDQKVISRSTSQKSMKPLYTYKSLAPEVKGRHMEALMVELEDDPDEDLSVHDGEEFIYVIRGTVQVHVGEETFYLLAGDSIYYLSTTPHLIAGKNGKATILAVLYEG